MSNSALHRVALARHLQFGEDGERLLQLLLLGFPVALRPRQKTPVASSNSRGCSCCPTPGRSLLASCSSASASSSRPHVLQDQRLVAVAALQPVLVAQLQADGFFLLVQRQRLLQPPPRLQDQRLVAVAALAARPCCPTPGRWLLPSCAAPAPPPAAPTPSGSAPGCRSCACSAVLRLARHRALPRTISSCLHNAKRCIQLADPPAQSHSPHVSSSQSSRLSSRRRSQRNSAAGMISSRHSRHSCQRVSQSLNKLSNAAAWRSCNLTRPSPPCRARTCSRSRACNWKRRRSRSSHAQQRGMHQPVGCVFRFVFAEFRNLGGQRQPEALLHAHGAGRQQSLLALRLRRDGRAEESVHIFRAVGQVHRAAA